MRKKMMIFLSLLVVISLVLSACSSSPASKQSNGKGRGIKDNVVTAAGKFPIAKKKVTLTVMIPSNPLVKDFKTNDFTKWYEKKTNVHIKWEVIPKSGAQKKLNLVLNSGNLPDIFMDMPLTPSQLMAYGSNGTFLALNSLIQKYGIQTKKMFKEIPLVKKTITTPNGKIYALPQVNNCYHCSMHNKLWIYKPWLKKLNLKMPTTVQQFQKVLEAFKTKDPNGNGKSDEIPLAGAKPGGWNSELTGYFMNPFIYSQMFVKNGKVVVPYNKPGWKKGLKYLHKLYAEGLIYSGTFTQDDNQLKSLGEHPGNVILGSATATGASDFVDISTKRGKDYVGVPPLKGPNGQITTYTPSPVTRPGEFVITKNCKYPAVALRWADAMYKRNITMRSVIGEQGIAWKKPKKGATGLNGKPATWEMIPRKIPVQNDSWMQTGPSLRTRAFRAGQAATKTSQNARLWQTTAKKYAPYIPKNVKSVPPLFFTKNQSDQLANLEQTITNYVQQMTAKFVTGQVGIDSGWKKYTQTLQNMGIKQYVKIYQDAYDAKYKK